MSTTTAETWLQQMEQHAHVTRAPLGTARGAEGLPSDPIAARLRDTLARAAEYASAPNLGEHIAAVRQSGVLEGLVMIAEDLERDSAQSDGLACMACGREFGPGSASRPAGFGPCGQLFACASHCCA
jgi:hypothetical protein